jgi:hypothetical protein
MNPVLVKYARKATYASTFGNQDAGIKDHAYSSLGNKVLLTRIIAASLLQAILEGTTTQVNTHAHLP